MSDGQTAAAAAAADRCDKAGHIQGGSKSRPKLLILSEYVKKNQEDSRNVNKYEQLQIK